MGCSSQRTLEQFPAIFFRVTLQSISNFGLTHVEFYVQLKFFFLTQFKINFYSGMLPNLTKLVNNWWETKQKLEIFHAIGIKMA